MTFRISKYVCKYMSTCKYIFNNSYIWTYIQTHAKLFVTHFYGLPISHFFRKVIRCGDYVLFIYQCIHNTTFNISLHYFTVWLTKLHAHDKQVTCCSFRSAGLSSLRTQTHIHTIYRCEL